MKAAEMAAGEKFALRYSITPGSLPESYQLAKTLYLGVHRGHKVKIRYLDGDLTGLEEWVDTRRIVSVWKERRAWSQDMHNGHVLHQLSREQSDAVVEEAISLVMASSGECGGFISPWEDTPAVILRMWGRAGLKGDPLRQPGAYEDRHGRWHLSFETAHTWARTFAAAEATAVAMEIDARERELTVKGYQFGETFAHRLLREERPAYAVARSWTRHRDHDHLEREVHRLDYLLGRALEELRTAGASDAASRIERERDR